MSVMFSRLEYQHSLRTCCSLLLRLVALCWLAEEVFCSSVMWPSGQYGLPMPKSNCPGANGFSWLRGNIYQDLEDGGNRTTTSPQSHLQAFVSNDVMQFFCMKTDMTSDTNRKPWPKGQYCIYQKGSSCPAGLLSGSVLWDDENGPVDGKNRNSHSGAIPEGVYNMDTKIFFCCSTSGNYTNPIELPTGKPFYLMAYRPHCQEVLNTVHTMEHIVYDTEDTNNHNKQVFPYPFGAEFLNPRISYCYYQAGKTTANSTHTTNSNDTGTTTTITTTITTTTAAVTITTAKATRPDTTSIGIKVSSEATTPFIRRSSSTPDTETTTNSSKHGETETSTAATDGRVIHEAEVKGRVVRVDVIYIIVGVVASLIAKGCAIVYLCRQRQKSISCSDQDRLSAAYSTPGDVLALNMKQNSVPNNNAFYSEINKMEKSDLSFKTSENGRVQSYSTYDEIKDRKNPLYSSSDNPNIYEELKENKNPLYSGNTSGDTENGRKRINPVYERVQTESRKKRNNPVYESMSDVLK